MLAEEACVQLVHESIKIGIKKIRLHERKLILSSLCACTLRSCQKREESEGSRILGNYGKEMTVTDV